MDIRKHWEEFIKKYPGLRHASGVPSPYLIAQEAHAAGWRAGEKEGKRKECEFWTATSRRGIITAEPIHLPFDNSTPVLDSPLLRYQRKRFLCLLRNKT